MAPRGRGEFQTLIGTVKSSSQARVPITCVKFQTLIGTVKSREGDVAEVVKKSFKPS